MTGVQTCALPISEREDGDNSKPEVLMMFGRCEDCKVITMCNLIKVKDIPNEKDFIRLTKHRSKK